MPGLVVHEPNHIWPILRVRYPGDGSNPRALAFAGTGFVLECGIFVTCWHCVSRPLQDGEAYVAVFRALGANDTQAGLIRLHGLAQDTTGTDLALARVSTPVVPGLRLAAQQAVQGEDVETWGYPLISPPTRREPDQQLVFNLNPRYLRGYVTQTFQFERPDGVEIASIELDMPTPEGLSGAPLLRKGTDEVVGVVYGTNEVASIDSIITVEADTGGRQVEVQRLEMFGLAHWTETLWSARGPATSGIALAGYETEVGKGKTPPPLGPDQ